MQDTPIGDYSYKRRLKYMLAYKSILTKFLIGEPYSVCNVDDILVHVNVTCQGRRHPSWGNQVFLALAHIGTRWRREWALRSPDFFRMMGIRIPQGISPFPVAPNLGGQNQKHKTCYFSWTNGWIISNFLSWVYISSMDTWHNTRLFDLTYFSRSQRSKFKTIYKKLACFVTIK
jgi:hypothetical protein